MVRAPGRPVVRIVDLAQGEAAVQRLLLRLDLDTQAVQLVDDRQVAVDVLRADRARPLEHHVLEEMRHAGDAGTLVDRTHLGDPAGRHVRVRPDAGRGAGSGRCRADARSPPPPAPSRQREGRGRRPAPRESEAVQSWGQCRTVSSGTPPVAPVPAWRPAHPYGAPESSATDRRTSRWPDGCTRSACQANVPGRRFSLALQAGAPGRGATVSLRGLVGLRYIGSFACALDAEVAQSGRAHD